MFKIRFALPFILLLMIASCEEDNDDEGLVVTSSEVVIEDSLTAIIDGEKIKFSGESWLEVDMQRDSFANYIHIIGDLPASSRYLKIELHDTIKPDTFYYPVTFGKPYFTWSFRGTTPGVSETISYYAYDGKFVIESLDPNLGVVSGKFEAKMRNYRDTSDYIQLEEGRFYQTFK